jgi:alpha-L-rhamnosidase
VEQIPAVKQWKNSDGGYLYDFGQNFSGWLRLTVQGPRGATVRMRFAEIIFEDGTLNTGPNRSAEATDVYVLKGGGVETWEPSFTYHGFRYAEVTGFPGVPGPSSVVGCFAHSDVPRAGEFSCSHDLINRIHGAVVRGQRSNLMSVPTDCSQRDERLGWMGDAGLSAEEAILNFDMAAFYVKFLRDIELSQKEDGSISDVVPPYWKMYPPDPAWGAAYLQIAWYLYHYYGDLRPLRRHYPSLKRYVDFLHGQAEHGILRKIRRFGDWCPPGSVSPKRTPIELTSTWYYYHDTKLLSRVAGLLGRMDDAESLSVRAAVIRDAFNVEFLTDRGYRVENTSPYDPAPGQTSNALPLFLDMAPSDRRALVLQRLLDSVVREQDYHVDTGIIGARFLFDVLTDNGHADVAFQVAAQKSYPGWGYMIEEGATTLWERWEKLEKGGMNSHNHIMTGSIDAWFYRALGGVTVVEPGWRRVRIKPPVLDGLDHAAVSFQTVRGPLRVSWERSAAGLRLVASLPVGMEAEVHLPRLGLGAAALESGAPVSSAEGVRVLSDAAEGLVVHVGSGFYDFTVGAG